MRSGVPAILYHPMPDPDLRQAVNCPGRRPAEPEFVAFAGLVLALILAGCGAALTETAEVQRIAEVLNLRPGMLVADVGAGNGEFSIGLAEQVGEDGRVYSTEIDEDQVDDIRRRIERAELGNVTPILGNDQDTGLPEDCCDAILLRLVYHHFTDPSPMRESLGRALRPGGLIAVIDFEPHGGWRRVEGVPDRGGHGIRPDDLIAEMTSDGFEVVARFDDWEGGDDRFCVVFRR